MLKRYLISVLLISVSCTLNSQSKPSAQVKNDKSTPIRGFCIAAPSPAGMNEFIGFIEKELVPRHVNTLILMVNYNFRFKSHPELRNDSAISVNDAKRLARTCKKYNIDLIPSIDLLGHQSWAGNLGSLLRVHQEFEEKTLINMSGQTPTGYIVKAIVRFIRESIKLSLI